MSSPPARLSWPRLVARLLMPVVAVGAVAAAPSAQAVPGAPVRQRVADRVATSHPGVGLGSAFGDAVLLAWSYRGEDLVQPTVVQDGELLVPAVTAAGWGSAMGEDLVMAMDHSDGTSAVVWSTFDGSVHGSEAVEAFRGWTADGWVEERYEVGGPVTLVERRPLGVDRTLTALASGSYAVAVTGNANGVAWLEQRHDGPGTSTSTVHVLRDGAAAPVVTDVTGARDPDVFVWLELGATRTWLVQASADGSTTTATTVGAGPVRTRTLEAFYEEAITPLGDELAYGDYSTYSARLTGPGGSTVLAADTAEVYGDGRSVVWEGETAVFRQTSTGSAPTVLVDKGLELPVPVVAGQVSPGQVVYLEDELLEEAEPAFRRTLDGAGYLSGTARPVVDRATGFAFAGWGPFLGYQSGDGSVVLRDHEGTEHELEPPAEAGPALDRAELSGRSLTYGLDGAVTTVDAVSGDVLEVVEGPEAAMVDVAGDVHVRAASVVFEDPWYEPVGTDVVRTGLRDGTSTTYAVDDVRDVAVFGADVAVATSAELLLLEPGSTVPRVLATHDLASDVRLEASDAYLVAVCDWCGLDAVLVDRDGAVSSQDLGVLAGLDDDRTLSHRYSSRHADSGLFLEDLPDVQTPPRLVNEPLTTATVHAGVTGWEGLFWFSKPLGSCTVEIVDEADAVAAELPCAATDGFARVGWDGTAHGEPVPAGTYTWRVSGADTEGTLLGHDLEEAGLTGSVKVSGDPGPEGPGFPDVPSTSPFLSDIEWMRSSGISTGYGDGTFRPADAVSRQAMAAFMYRFAGQPAFTPPGTATFVDVPVGSPFFTQVEWMAAEGISTGYGDGTFRPAATVTRQAMSAFLFRLVATGQEPAPGAASFSDVGVSSPFFGSVEWMARTGISTGYQDRTFRPGASVSRQAMAAFMHRADAL